MASPGPTKRKAMSTTVAEKERRDLTTEKLDEVVIRFAGDSGDGMQITGIQFTNTSALIGNDLSTLPDFPAEIRAPAGTLPGVSAFQVRIADYDIHTPGDAPDVLVAMNPAALKKELQDLKPNGVVIVNTDEFNERNFATAGYAVNPLEDDSLDGYRVFPAALTTMTRRALEGQRPRQQVDGPLQEHVRPRHVLLAVQPADGQHHRLARGSSSPRSRSSPRPTSRCSRRAGTSATSRSCSTPATRSPAAALEPGLYRNITGNVALALGLIAASRRSGLPLFLGAYPITPASDVLHELSKYKNYGVTTFQAEDEIAAVCAAIGASFGGALGVTTHVRPGHRAQVRGDEPGGDDRAAAGRSATSSAAARRPACRPRPSRPTCCRSMFGRNGESPMPVIAASSPKDCFDVALEAVRIATQLHGAGGAPLRRLHRQRLRALEAAEGRGAARPARRVPHRSRRASCPTSANPETLARPWAIPGTPGLEHRIGGLEKEDVTGNVSYDPENHEKMVHLRAEKVARIARDIPPLEVHGDAERRAAGPRLGLDVRRHHRRGQHGPRKPGLKVSRAHLRYLNPFPANLGEVLARFEQRPGARDEPRPARAAAARPLSRRTCIVCTKVQGQPFTRQEILDKIHEILEHNIACPLRRTTPTLTKKDFQTDQEVRWCPGCGDYAILSAVQQVFPELGIPREKFVVVSGIGCSSRFPYYMNTFGFHSIHGRAPAVATGLKLARPELEVWIATGDGDAMSIGGNHLIHTLRRNVGVKILMFNNRIYGLTKGQYSPTSELGKKTKSTPVGSVDYPFNPLSLALGAGATFVARSVDIFQPHLRDTSCAAPPQHKGTAFIEIYQNCNIFNDKAFTYMTDKETQGRRRAATWSTASPWSSARAKDKGIRMRGTEMEVIELGGEFGRATTAWSGTRSLHNPATAFLAAQLLPPHFPTALGVFRNVERADLRDRGSSTRSSTRPSAWASASWTISCRPATPGRWRSTARRAEEGLTPLAPLSHRPPNPRERGDLKKD